MHVLGISQLYTAKIGTDDSLCTFPTMLMTYDGIRVQSVDNR